VSAALVCADGVGMMRSGFLAETVGGYTLTPIASLDASMVAPSPAKGSLAFAVAGACCMGLPEIGMRFEAESCWFGLTFIVLPPAAMHYSAKDPVLDLTAPGRGLAGDEMSSSGFQDPIGLPVYWATDPAPNEGEEAAILL